VQAVVNMVMNIWAPRNARNFLTSQGYGRFSTHTQRSISFFLFWSTSHVTVKES